MMSEYAKLPVRSPRSSINWGVPVGGFDLAVLPQLSWNLFQHPGHVRADFAVDMCCMSCLRALSRVRSVT